MVWYVRCDLLRKSSRLQVDAGKEKKIRKWKEGWGVVACLLNLITLHRVEVRRERVKRLIQSEGAAKCQFKTLQLETAAVANSLSRTQDFETALRVSPAKDSHFLGGSNQNLKMAYPVKSRAATRLRAPPSIAACLGNCSLGNPGQSVNPFYFSYRSSKPTLHSW
jgi:hypothetical protein